MGLQLYIAGQKLSMWKQWESSTKLMTPSAGGLPSNSLLVSRAHKCSMASSYFSNTFDSHTVLSLQQLQCKCVCVHQEPLISNLCMMWTEQPLPETINIKGITWGKQKFPPKTIPKMWHTGWQDASYTSPCQHYIPETLHQEVQQYFASRDGKSLYILFPMRFCTKLIEAIQNH